MLNRPQTEAGRIVTQLNLLDVNKINRRSNLRKQSQMNNFRLTNRTYVAERKVLQADSPNRFKKHKNLVETNKTLLSRVATSIPQLHRIPSIKEVKTKFADFIPKILDEMSRQSMKGQLFPMRWGPEGLQGILKKERMKKPRNLLSYNILRLQKKFNLSRFELHGLYSTYHTLLRDSGASMEKFKKGFQVMFSMNKVLVRPEVLEKIFSQQKEIDFQNFVGMYSRIEYNIYQQSIIDYVDILFEGLYDKEHIRFEDIVRLFRNRITDKEATDIARIIYEHLDRHEEKYVTLKEIEELCYCSQIFAKKMYRLYTNDCKSD